MGGVEAVRGERRPLTAARDRFAGRVAERYDETPADMFAPEVLDPAVEFPAAPARGGAALPAVSVYEKGR